MNFEIQRERERLLDFVAKYPFAVLNATEGVYVYRIHDVERHSTVVVQIVHDTTREDPTLVFDTLEGTHNPEERRKCVVHAFHAFFPTLESAIAAIASYEKEQGATLRKEYRTHVQMKNRAERKMKDAERSIARSSASFAQTHGGTPPPDIYK